VQKKTDVAEDERDTQFMRSTSLVLALRLLRQRNAEGSEHEGFLGNYCRRNPIHFTDCQMFNLNMKYWKP
jgi:hypothetical protein